MITAKARSQETATVANPEYIRMGEENEWPMQVFLMIDSEPFHWNTNSSAFNDIDSTWSVRNNKSYNRYFTPRNTTTNNRTGISESAVPGKAWNTSMIWRILSSGEAIDNNTPHTADANLKHSCQRRSNNWGTHLMLSRRELERNVNRNIYDTDVW